MPSFASLATMLPGLVPADREQWIYLGAAVYTAFVLSWSLVTVWRVRRWPSVSGRLQVLGERTFGSEGFLLSEREYAADVRYTYEVDGREYAGKRLSPWLVVVSHNARFVLQRQLRAARVGPDGTVEVLYNPRRPQKSYLVRPGRFGMIVLAMGTLPLIVGYIAKYGG